MRTIRSPRTARVLASLPPEYGDEPTTLALIDAFCLDLDRIEAMMRTVQVGVFPGSADDTYRLLGMMETEAGLPVEPPGATLEERRQKLRALRSRSVSEGSQWMAAVTEALGTPNWSHIENAGNSITVIIAWDPNGYQAGVIGRILRKITPAHLSVGGAYSQGFIIGSSLLGVQTL
jgi:hypothetical protein